MARGNYSGTEYSKMYFANPKMKKGVNPIFSIVAKTDDGWEEIDKCKWIEGTLVRLRQVTLNENTQYDEKEGVEITLMDENAEAYVVRFYLDSFSGRNVVNRLARITDFSKPVRLSLYQWETNDGTMQNGVSVKQDGNKLDPVISAEQMKSMVKRIEDGKKVIVLTADLDSAISVLLEETANRLKESENALPAPESFDPNINPKSEENRQAVNDMFDIPEETPATPPARAHRTVRRDPPPVEPSDDLPF